MNMCREGTRRILLIDDDHDFRATVASVLDDVGYTVAQASNRADALAQLLVPADPCLVLLDLGMALDRKRGFLHEQLCTQKLRTLPVVVFATPARHHVSDFGARKVLPKPVTLHALLAAVGQFCGVPRLRSN